MSNSLGSWWAATASSVWWMLWINALDNNIGWWITLPEALINLANETSLKVSGTMAWTSLEGASHFIWALAPFLTPVLAWKIAWDWGEYLAKKFWIDWETSWTILKVLSSVAVWAWVWLWWSALMPYILALSASKYLLPRVAWAWVATIKKWYEWIVNTKNTIIDTAKWSWGAVKTPFKAFINTSHFSWKNWILAAT